MTIAFTLWWTVGYFLPDVFSATFPYRAIREELQSRIEGAGELTVGDELIQAPNPLTRFYGSRGFLPAWVDEGGLCRQAEELLESIRGAYREGLRPGNYHLAKIKRLMAEVDRERKRRSAPNPQRMTDLDLLLTDAFIVLGSHFHAGRVNPETFDPEWVGKQQKADFSLLLKKAIQTDRIGETLQSLLPTDPDYERLRQALARHREIAAKGGWPLVPRGEKVERGTKGERVAALRARLLVTGDLEGGPTENRDTWDEELERAVIRFQLRHALKPDGVVGGTTIYALNVPVEERIREIELNMERWRWLPRDLGKRHILVNLADFKLEVVESGRPVMDMRIIVGMGARRTPVFSGKMTHLVLNPYWNVPASIATEDKLPLISKNPGYLDKQNMRVFRGWGEEEEEVSPESINWNEVSGKPFKYHLRQDPGPLNALGRVKFVFPNRFNVYIHDTPYRELFSRDLRTFSSGCIRIEKPLELAEYVLKGDRRWNRGAIEAALEKPGEKTVRLPSPIDVHLLYWTAFVDEEGVVHFPRDIYGRDTLLGRALRAKAPSTKKS